VLCLLDTICSVGNSLSEGAGGVDMTCNGKEYRSCNLESSLEQSLRSAFVIFRTNKLKSILRSTEVTGVVSSKCEESVVALERKKR